MKPKIITIGAYGFDEDEKLSVAKRTRKVLGQTFIQAYEKECLSTFNTLEFIEQLGQDAQVIGLFCVEREPEACHRSLAAKRLAQDLELQVEHIKPWQGGPEQLFDGLLVIDNWSSYISNSRGIPNYSTGYWLPNRPLNLTQKNEKPYYQIKYDMYDHYQGTLSIKYVGFANPIQYIPANTMIRVSLARWWMPTGVNDERCYVQLSGWYL